MNPRLGLVVGPSAAAGTYYYRRLVERLANRGRLENSGPEFPAVDAANVHIDAIAERLLAS
jgi:hypothetical protein